MLPVGEVAATMLECSMMDSNKRSARASRSSIGNGGSFRSWSSPLSTRGVRQSMVAVGAGEDSLGSLGGSI